MVIPKEKQEYFQSEAAASKELSLDLQLIIRTFVQDLVEWLENLQEKERPLKIVLVPLLLVQHLEVLLVPPGYLRTLVQDLVELLENLQEKERP
jgi:hypothetical protein